MEERIVSCANPSGCDSDRPSDERFCKSTDCPAEEVPSEVVLDFNAKLSGTGTPPEPETVVRTTTRAFSMKLGVEEEAILVRVRIRRLAEFSKDSFASSAWQMDVSVEVRCKGSVAAEVVQELAEIRQNPENIEEILPPGTSMQVSSVSVQASEELGHKSGRMSVPEDSEETEDASSPTLVAVVLSCVLAMLAVVVACCRRRSVMAWRYRVMAEESVVDQPQTHVTKIDDEACEKLSIGEGESTRPPSSASSHSSGTPVKDLLKASIGSARPASSASSAHSSASLDAKMLLQELREVANPSLTDLQGDDAQPLWSPPACSSKFMAHLELPVMQADVSSGEADDSDGRPQLNSDSPVCRAWHLASVCVPASASNPSRRPDVAMNQLPIGSLHSQQFRSPRGLPLTPPTRTLSSSSVSPPQVRVPPKPPEVVSGDELQEVSAQKKNNMCLGMVVLKERCRRFPRREFLTYCR
jgi:hypothetical protein